MPGAKVGTLCRKILLMNKLKMHSPDLTQANIDKLAALFPIAWLSRRTLTVWSNEALTLTCCARSWAMSRS